MTVVETVLGWTLVVLAIVIWAANGVMFAAL